VGDEIAAVGRVMAKRVLPTRKGLRIFHAVLRDESGLLECVWPGQAFLDRTIHEGQLLLVSGPVRFYHGRQMAPREFIILGDADDAESAPEGLILPIYPATEGLGHRQIRGLEVPLMRPGTGIAALGLAVGEDPLALRETGPLGAKVGRIVDVQGRRCPLAQGQGRAQEQGQGVDYFHGAWSRSGFGGRPGPPR
jgi:hypothetical protein